MTSMFYVGEKLKQVAATFSASVKSETACETKAGFYFAFTSSVSVLFTYDQM